MLPMILQNVASVIMLIMQAALKDNVIAVPPRPTVLGLGLRRYLPVWQQMRQFSRSRAPGSRDSFWWLQHHPVYTTGLREGGESQESGQPAKINGIPLVATDRGGLRTCHSPGQLVVYPLLNLPRLGLGASSYIHLLEQGLISVLAAWDIEAARREGMPGVYVNGAKIASVGVRLSSGNSYHGLALNISNDLGLFDAIIPCGISGLRMTKMADHAPGASVEKVAHMLIAELWQRLYGEEYEY